MVLLHSNCLDFIDSLPYIDAIVTDPPYGAGTNTNYTRFTKGAHQNERKNFKPIIADNIKFDPTPWLDFPQVIMWGYQHIADTLPLGTVLVWLKRRDSKIGKFMSDCELAWQKGGKGVYLFKHVWDGFDRETERGQRTVHPAQKPVALMKWCIERVTKLGDTVLDPYMGSGSTGVACQELGRSFIGIEIDPTYFQVAKERLGV